MRLERLRIECKTDLSLFRRRASLAAKQTKVCSTFDPQIQFATALEIRALAVSGDEEISSVPNKKDDLSTKSPFGKTFGAGERI